MRLQQMQWRQRQQKPRRKPRAMPPDSPRGRVYHRHRRDREQHRHDARGKRPLHQHLRKQRASGACRLDLREERRIRDGRCSRDEVEVETAVVEEVRIRVAQRKRQRSAQRVKLVRMVREEMRLVRQSPLDADQPHRKRHAKHHRHADDAPEPGSAIRCLLLALLLCHTSLPTQRRRRQVRLAPPESPVDARARDQPAECMIA